MVFLLLKIGMDGLPIDDLVDFEQWEAVNGNDGLGGFLEKAAHGKFSKFGLGEFRGFFFWGGECKSLRLPEKYFKANLSIKITRTVFKIRG